MNSKGDANMWWIIIGAVVALVVMIVLMVMFTGKSNKLEGGLSACDSKGGKCIVGTACPGNSLPGPFDCLDADGKSQVCCIGNPKS